MKIQALVATAILGAMVNSQTALVAQQVGQQNGSGQQPYVIKLGANIVLNNVVVRDKKTHELVTGLKASDFTVIEDKKQQRVSSFDYQNVDQAVALSEKNTPVMGKSIAQLMAGDIGANAQELRDHRLMVVFFDLSSMQDDDIDRAVDAAKKYVTEQMNPADLVALVSMSTGLSMDQDFTSNKDLLVKGLSKYNGTDLSGTFSAGATGDNTAGSDDTSTFTADDSEFNSLNVDRELFAIRAIAKSLERVDQKKSMLYFSGGLTRNGIENQASLRAATNEAVRANLSIYSVDSRGLQALPPVGDASKGSLRGTSAYTGAAATAQLTANAGSQEMLSTLSTDTGGKFYSDSNDFGPAFTQVQHDTEAYYIVGFKSSNQAQDGSYRHLTIKVNRPDTEISYRPGYWAPADFKHAKTEDREFAMTEALKSDLPMTDVAVYLQALYFRLNDNSFYIPVSLVVPGSQIPFVEGKTDKATLDIIGQVKNAQNLPVGNIRQTVPLNLDATKNAKQKNIQYSTGFTLAPGKYHMKFVVRENQTGNMGDYETDLNVPDMKKLPMKLSSIVLSNQRVANTTKPVKGATPNPLVRDGEEWIPNIPHVFRQDQHLYFLYEVYDPTHAKTDAPSPTPVAGLETRPPIGGIHVLTSIEFMQNGTKVYETPLVEATSINNPERGAVSFQFDVPLTPLKPGLYVCQVNVIDDTGGSFSFPRMALKVNAAAVPAGTPVAAVTPAP